MRTRLARPLAARLARVPGLVLVPGGGMFADAVRDAQPQLSLRDAACHRMAVLAMEQMAHALADMAPHLVPCVSAEQMARLEGRAAVWLPASMVLADKAIPESWDVTSDSLAAWLAVKVRARRLVLIKAPGARTPSGPATPDALVEAGLVDVVFPALAADFSGPIFCLAADDEAGLSRLFPFTPECPTHPKAEAA